MSKKTILKWICTATAVCSFYAGATMVSADDELLEQPVAAESSLATASETPAVSDVVVTEETTIESENLSPIAETEASSVLDGSVTSEATTETEVTVPSEPVSRELPKAYQTDFETFDEATMETADWWNGNPFGTVWKPDKVAVNNGIMTLTLDKGTDTTAPVDYISGELRTKDFFHYGTYKVSMKPIKNPGTVSSFFTYTGPSDNNPWDEVDIEFLGKDTTKVQFNYYTNGHGEHEYVHDLGFDASESFHTYAFDWQKDYITWYVDGKAVYTATENIPVTPGKIMMNAWAGTGVDEWLEPFDGKTPLVASYDWFRYTATEPVTAPLPPVEAPDINEVTETQPHLSAPAVSRNQDSPAPQSQAFKGQQVEEVAEQPLEKKIVTLPKTGSQDSPLAIIGGVLLTMLSVLPFLRRNPNR